MRILILFNINNFAEHASAKKMFHEFKDNAEKQGMVKEVGEEWMKLSNGDVLEVIPFQKLSSGSKYKYDEIYIPASSYELFKILALTMIRSHHHNKDSQVKQFSYVNGKLVSM